LSCPPSQLDEKSWALITESKDVANPCKSAANASQAEAAENKGPEPAPAKTAPN
jgi:hypothetical protein